jgi:hypothetical protein
VGAITNWICGFRKQLFNLTKRKRRRTKKKLGNDLPRRPATCRAPRSKFLHEMVFVWSDYCTSKRMREYVQLEGLEEIKEDEESAISRMKKNCNNVHYSTAPKLSQSAKGPFI